MRRQGSGQALVEYVVLLAVGSLIAIGTVSLAGTQLSQAYSQVTTLLANPAAAIVPTASPSPSELATATTPTTPTAPAPTAPAPAASGATASAATAATPTPGASHDAAGASHSAGHAVGNGHAHD
jgi:Flp pilus assembly pilin Flp